MRLYLVIFCLAMLLGGALGTPPAATAEAAEPVRIESDRMESGEEPNSIIFSGQVVARQGDLVVHAARMTIFYLSREEQEARPPDDQRRIKKLYAEEQVRIETEEWIGTGDFMEYFELERKVYLTGNAKAWQDNNLVTGEAITLYLDEGRSIVERGGQPEERVRAFFYSGNDTAAPETEDAPPTPPNQAETP